MTMIWALGFRQAISAILQLQRPSSISWYGMPLRNAISPVTSSRRRILRKSTNMIFSRSIWWDGNMKSLTQLSRPILRTSMKSYFPLSIRNARCWRLRRTETWLIRQWRIWSVISRSYWKAEQSLISGKHYKKWILSVPGFARTKRISRSFRRWWDTRTSQYHTLRH